MTPDWYELLDVPRDADAGTIRAAWKVAVADLDPTDRTFRIYSQAASVLLDDERRAAYDEQLAAEEGTSPEEAPDAAESPESVETTPPVTPEAAPEQASEESPAAAPGRPGLAVPTWLLAGICLLTVLVAAGALALHLTAPNDPSLRAVLGEVAWWDEDEPASGDVAVPPSAAGAQQAAEQAVGPLTAYDYERLDESRDAALEVVTSDFGEQYEKLYEGAVRDNAVETQTVVSIKAVRASAVGRVEDDGRVHVLVFFDREVRNKALSNPRTYEDQATLVMEKVDDRWLVADLKTVRPPD